MKNDPKRNLIPFACLDKHLGDLAFGIADVKFKLHNQRIVKLFGKKIFSKDFKNCNGNNEAVEISSNQIIHKEKLEDDGEMNIRLSFKKGRIQKLEIETEVELDFESLN